jgi:hypothetical protein
MTILVKYCSSGAAAKQKKQMLETPRMPFSSRSRDRKRTSVTWLPVLTIDNRGTSAAALELPPGSSAAAAAAAAVVVAASDPEATDASDTGAW